MRQLRLNSLVFSDVSSCCWCLLRIFDLRIWQLRQFFRLTTDQRFVNANHLKKNMFFLLLGLRLWGLVFWFFLHSFNHLKSHCKRTGHKKICFKNVIYLWNFKSWASSVVGCHQEQPHPTGGFNTKSREAGGVHQDLQVRHRKTFPDVFLWLCVKK